METLSPYKYELTVGKNKKTVFLSFGLKEEIQKKVFKTFIAIKMSQADSMIDKKTRDKIQALYIKYNGITDEKEKAKVTTKIASLKEKAISESMEQSANKQANLAEQITNIIFNSRVEVLSAMLSERDEKGKVVTEVNKEEIQWSEDYAAIEGDLNELFGIALASVMEALKKTKLQEIISENMGNLTEMMSSD